MKYSTEQWWHVYLYLIISTFLVAAFTATITQISTIPFLISFGAMGFISGAAFLAESTVTGATAKAGGLFFTCLTCILVCYFLPIPN